MEPDIMRKLYLLAILLVVGAIPTRAQSTTDTNCQANGNQVNCTSNTTGSTNSTTNTGVYTERFSHSFSTADRCSFFPLGVTCAAFRFLTGISE